MEARVVRRKRFAPGPRYAGSVERGQRSLQQPITAPPACAARQSAATARRRPTQGRWGRSGRSFAESDGKVVFTYTVDHEVHS